MGKFGPESHLVPHVMVDSFTLVLLREHGSNKNRFKLQGETFLQKQMEFLVRQ